MEKIIKKILIVIAIVIAVILLDTMQALIFNNSPIIHTRRYREDDIDIIHYVDRGIFADHYVYRDGRSKTLSKWAIRNALPF